MKIDVAFVLAALIGLQSGVGANPMVDELNTLARRQSGSFYSPPVYPAPKGGWTPDWADAYGKAKKLVEQMTLAEKVNVTTSIGWMNGLCVGNTGTVDRLGFPSLCAQDGPLAVRYADLITVFPAGITAGATWDRDLIYQRANAMGAESKAKGVHVLLAPSVGPLGRQPAGGRNWEGFGSDPYLQGVGGYQSVKGIQDAGTQACVKHWIANEQEHYRGDGGGPDTISPNVDDRTMHEVYMWPFAESVKAGVASVMCAYNQVNGSYACENSKINNGLLKDELGFQGYIMSDWLGQRSGVASSLAGMDQTQPGDGARWANGVSFWGSELSRSVLNGSVPIDRLNDQATRIVAAWYQLGQDKNYPKVSFSSWTKADTDVAYKGSNSGPRIKVNDHIDVRGNHATIAKNVARDGITLLKNEGNVLPLSKDAVVRVFGTGAAPNPQGMNSCVDKACNKGTLTMGWGSGTADFETFSSPIDAIKARASNTQSSISDKVDGTATQLASAANARCLVFVTANGGERYMTVEGHEGDRNNLNLWNNGDELIKGIANACPNTIVIVNSVGAVNMEQWADLPNVKAIVLAHLPGQEAGSSLVEVLFGDVSPSGHLPYTIGKSILDYGSSVQIQKSPGAQVFSEGLYIDYKWFDKQGITPRYPFGYGLSYTTFEYSGLSAKTVKTPTEEPGARPARLAPPSYSTAMPNPNEVAWPSSITFRPNLFVYPYLNNPQSIQKGNYPYPTGYSTTDFPPSKAGGAQGGHPELWDVIYEVSVNVKNTGKVTGKAVPQLYLQFPKDAGYDTPIRQLRGFDKVELKAGESKTVTFQLTRKDLSVWDVVKQQWVIPKAGAGGYTVHVGSSSRDLPLSCNVLSCSGSASTSTSATATTTTSVTSTTPTTTPTSTTTTAPTTTSVVPTTTSTSTTTSTTTTPTPTPTPSGCASTLWGQCGGQGYNGCKTCPSGAKCMVYNDHYAQCIPA